MQEKFIVDSILTYFTNIDEMFGLIFSRDTGFILANLKVRAKTTALKNVRINLLMKLL